MSSGPARNSGETGSEKETKVPADLSIVQPIDSDAMCWQSIHMITDILISKEFDGLKRHFRATVHMPHDSMKEHYLDIIINVSIVYHVSHRLAASEPEVASWLDDHDSLCRFMSRLEDECGISENLSPDMTRSKHDEIVAKLDADRAVFKGIVQEAVDGLAPEHDMLVFFLYFASMLFKFNGYQAPPRTSIREARLDAAGLSDLWGELLQEVGYEDEST